ncbi:MAG: hypothetical protein CEN89_592 [Candidatus Berkelbacteria bacterium Licking1014_7]|uniref:Uncharacterized protein n=1 Tax=Candidatus Berkelbacteria bacterium Licking1014_7 TaxID=2017147 RepID=A0A554LI85_9BACT|nr:MAG: hypothetical protein CEN89_592 [Candidatus Berkelbacteria bacterium Licking1014_7]
MNTVLPIGARQTGELARLLEERGCGKSDFQLLGENPDDVVALIEQIKQRNPYICEQCDQAWFYPEGFAMPTLETQAGRLQKVLGFEPKWPEAAQNLSFSTGEFGVDGIGLWPILPTLGQLWDIENPRGAGYGKVIATVCTTIIDSPEMAPLVNWRTKNRDELTLPDYVRIVVEVRDILVPLEEAALSQGYNCLAMPVCLGNWGTKICYSPRNALWQILHWDPKGLAIEPVAGLSLAIGTKVLTAYGQQWKDFPGAQYNWERDGLWSDSLSLYFFDDARFEFYARDARYARGLCGSLFARPGVSGLAA